MPTSLLIERSLGQSSGVTRQGGGGEEENRMIGPQTPHAWKATTC